MKAKLIACAAIMFLCLGGCQLPESANGVQKSSNTNSSNLTPPVAVLPQTPAAAPMLASEGPVVSSFTPVSGAPGTDVRIIGLRLGDTRSVKFGGAIATLTYISSTELKAFVPSTARTGSIEVTTGLGTVTSSVAFTVPGTVPVSQPVEPPVTQPGSGSGLAIIAVTPTSGAPGTDVQITGRELGDTRSVKFGGALATLTYISGTELKALVPTGARTGSIEVVTGLGSVTSTQIFTVPGTVPVTQPPITQPPITQPGTDGPAIVSFAPTSGGPGADVRITGRMLAEARSVKFGGALGTLTYISGTELKATVPANARTGAVEVVTAQATLTSSQVFTVPGTTPGTQPPNTEPPVVNPPTPPPTPYPSPSSSPSATPPPVNQPPAQPDTPINTSSAGYLHWKNDLQGLIATNCKSCHIGPKFGIATLLRAGATSFTDAETKANYSRFFETISLDAPETSRLLAKMLPSSDPRAIQHAGAAEGVGNATLRASALRWAQLEKSDRCPSCGLTAPRSYIAYVRQPEKFWAISKFPKNGAYGARSGAKIMLQPLTAGSLQPSGNPIDFLAGQSFCSNGDCDFGYLAPNHAGTQLAFECRIPIRGERWINRAWNICLADIGADGRALNPRFLLPADKRQSGWTYTRTGPFGYLGSDNVPLKSIDDDQYRIRQRNDFHPVFSPDDQRIYFISSSPDPRNGDDAVETYHGELHLANLIAVKLDGSDPRLIYKNDGGQVDSPFFRKNGNVAAHTWNLERMDRHMIMQGTQDGQVEHPILVGAVQEPNMWGRTVELNNGLIFGMTGARRGAHEQFAPFVADHTLGTGLDRSISGLRSLYFLIPGLFEEILPYPNGFCRREDAPNGPNCKISKLITDPSWAPDGRALVTYNPEPTYLAFGEGTSLLLQNTSADDLAQRFEQVKPYLPKRMGVGVLDDKGNIQTVLSNATGTMSRYPVWVGKRQAPKIQTWKTKEVSKVNPDPRENASTLHIADFSLWLSFADNRADGNKAGLIATLDRITKVRVLYKDMSATACLRDTGAYWCMVNSGNTGNHPTALGIADSTGYIQWRVPQALGGDMYGDIPLKFLQEGDRSIRMKIPAGKNLLFQGINEQGHVVAQRSRLLTLPPGHHDIDTSVKRSQYATQCASCHGTIDGSPFRGLAETARMAGQLDFNTSSKERRDLIDLTAPGVTEKKLTYLHAIRPILDAKCVSCHSASNPMGDLSLSATYSSTGNFPTANWANPERTVASYFNTGPYDYGTRRRVESHDFSMSYRYILQRSDGYKDYVDSPYLAHIANDTPVGARTAWDPGYQNLFRRKLRNPQESYYYYLSHDASYTGFGRSSALGGNSSSSFLIEILSGRNLDPVSSLSSSHTDIMARSGVFLTDEEIRTFQAVIDVGFPYMSRCDDRRLPMDGLPNQGRPYGETTYTPFDLPKGPTEP